MIGQRASGDYVVHFSAIQANGRRTLEEGAQPKGLAAENLSRASDPLFKHTRQTYNLNGLSARARAFGGGACSPEAMGLAGGS